METDWSGRWDHLQKIVERGGPFAHPDFEPSPEILSFLKETCKILVIGAGGLGCELLKDLALMGFRDIHVIDMDTIDVSNLNRQFLFRARDVGKAKADVAAAFINARVPGCKVTPHYAKIQDFDDSFYRDFHIVVCGLDSIIARRWMNGMLISLLTYEDGELDQSSLIPMVDGGTEGFKGNARVILPGITASGVGIDGDDPKHIQWILEKSQERANEYNISGITYRLTQGVVKRIMPAVASTNAVIAASCATETFKIATSCCLPLNNYMNFNDTNGVYTYTFEAERLEGCLACSNKPQTMNFSETDKLQDIITYLQENASLQMKAPGVTTSMGGKNKTLYMQTVKSIEAKTRDNLKLSLKELGLEDGQELYVADVTTPNTLTFQLRIATTMDNS
ncbi:NEDD8-activating enzyme E1 catalytic subunit [Elysia marginata]|uniref:NEDD8-activating enzyme E1 catalytic subunit n=1 Tax=Elysia marginata TaxID=1093978 RepID=A0AAV4FBG7_9GAST|nr:NEDD8-activating enzyme E1 catalytic subunit [Elysia marginata]